MAKVTRRAVLGTGAAMAVAGTAGVGLLAKPSRKPHALEEVDYSAVAITDPVLAAQRQNVTEVLLGLPDDALMKPFRAMSGQDAPGLDLRGWYQWRPEYNFHHDDAGLAPGATFGQWHSAMSRLAAGGGPAELKDKALRLRPLLHGSMGKGCFEQNRFPAYCFDKLACGLMDARRLSGDPDAWDTLDHIRKVADSSLPDHAVDRDTQWKIGKDGSWMWDESFTMPENLYLVYTLGAGSRYRQMAERYLDDRTLFEPLARGEDALRDRQAYSYVNALNSAMQAWLTAGSGMHLTAARKGFDIVERQSFVTGGWGPDEQLGPDNPWLSLTKSHNNFETPCGSFAHMKLTRYLLRATGEGRYGDSMERVLWNTVAGAMPLQPDGRSFYSADYNWAAKRVYSQHRWPCCSGTLPQVVSDYGVNSYLRSPGEVWVVLYFPGQLRFEEGGVPVRLTQDAGWLDEGTARLRVDTARPVSFSLRLRVPEWAGAHQVLVNGQPVDAALDKGFAVVRRTWAPGDAVELRTGFAPRLETMRGHTDTAALLWGPRVLFALRQPGDPQILSFKPDALLGAERTAPNEWRVGGRVFVPWTEVGDREYSTYVRLS